MGTNKKIGRPFAGSEPLSRDTKIKVSEKTYAELKAYSEKHNITVAEVIRQAIYSFLKKQ